MNESREISALFKLLDDPDKEVFGAVSDKLIHYGKPIIPNLSICGKPHPMSRSRSG
jgi:hypothetical protein